MGLLYAPGACYTLEKLNWLKCLECLYSTLHYSQQGLIKESRQSKQHTNRWLVEIYSFSQFISTAFKAILQGMLLFLVYKWQNWGMEKSYCFSSVNGRPKRTIQD